MTAPKLTATVRAPLGVAVSSRGTVDATVVAAALGGVPHSTGGRADPKRSQAGALAARFQRTQSVTQVVSVATLVGESAGFAFPLFDRWRAVPDPDGVDRFCAALRQNAQALPVVYFAEWLDSWSMGDHVPGPHAVAGRRFQADCLLPSEALHWADSRSGQFEEYRWLATRLREAATVWGGETSRDAVVVLRNVIGVSRDDDDVARSLADIPGWLTAFGEETPTA